MTLRMFALKGLLKFVTHNIKGYVKLNDATKIIHKLLLKYTENYICFVCVSNLYCTQALYI